MGLTAGFPPTPLQLALVAGTPRTGKETADLNLLGAHLDLTVAELAALEAQILAGTVSANFVWQGAWSSLTTYALNNVVRGTDGGAYISLQANNLNHAITLGGSNAWWGFFVAPGAAGTNGLSGSSTFMTFGQTGTLTVGTGVLHFVAPRTMTIVSASTYANTVPTGATCICDINKNGTTIFTTQGNRPTIAISAHSSGIVTNMNVTSLAAGDIVSFDIDQVGSTIAGADLTVTLEVS